MLTWGEVPAQDFQSWGQAVPGTDLTPLAAAILMQIRRLLHLNRLLSFLP